MSTSELSRYLLEAGTILPVVAGLGHAALTAADVFRPRSFTPVDDAVRVAMTTTGMRFAPRWTTMWRAWLGFNISHGVGIAAFNLVLLLLAIYDFGVFRDMRFLIPLAAAIGALYLLVAIRFWFFVPAILAGTSTTLFIASAIVLPAQ